MYANISQPFESFNQIVLVLSKTRTTMLWKRRVSTFKTTKIFNQAVNQWNKCF